MSRPSDIYIMANLKFIFLSFNGNEPIATPFVLAIQEKMMDYFGYPKMSQDTLKMMQLPLNQPKKAYYINAFLDLGFTPTQIGKWFDLSSAGVSWHKTNPPTKEYINGYLMSYREHEHTSSKK